MRNRGLFPQDRGPRSGGRRRLAWIGVALAAATVAIAVPLRSAAPAEAWGLPGLVAAYGFDEGSGSAATDQSGLGNGGTISGASWTAGGKFGSALSFDGVDDWVTVPDAPSLDLTTGMTLSAWVKPRVLVGRYRQAILKEQTGGLVYGLYANTSSSVPRGSAVLNGRIRSVDGAGLLPLDTWSHVAVTFDNVVIRFYLNGVLVSSLGKSGPIAVSTGPLRIGGNSIFSEWFDGLVDEVRVYNRALSAADLLTDMGTSVSPPPPDTEPPTAPASLDASASVSSGGTGTVTVTWTTATDNTGVDHYNVYRGTTPGFTPSTSNRIALVGGTSHADGGRPAGTYYYRVAAEDAAGNVGPPSPQATAVVPDIVAPTTTTGLTAVGGPASASLSWNPASDNVGVHHYDVHRGTSLGFTPSAANKIAEATGTGYTDTGRPAGTFFYAVTAVDAAGNVGAASNQATAVVPDTISPATPTGLVVAGSVGQATLTWTASSDDVGVDHYNVYRSTVAGFLASPANFVGEAAGTSFADVTTPGIYFYRVDAEDAAGNLSPASDEVSGSVDADTTAPTRPTGLSASVTGSSTELSWAAASDDVGVHHYNVHRGSSARFVPTPENRIGEPTGPAFEDPDLAAGTYYYVVTAEDAAGNVGPASDEASSVVTDTTPPGAPAGLTAVRNGTSIDLSWAAATDDVGVVHYNVHRGTTAGFTPTPGNRVGQPAGTSFSDAGLGAGTHYYAVTAEDAVGHVGAQSNEASASIPDTTAPSIPSGVTALGGAAAVSLAWTASTDDVGVAHYDVYRSTVAGFLPAPANRVGQPGGTGFTDTGLAAGVYFYRVAAADAAGNLGAASSEVSATVPDTTAPSAPGGLGVVVSGHAAQLTWTAATDDVGVAHYDVHRGTAAGFTPTPANRIAQPAGTSYSDPSLAAGTYYYRVIAEDAAGNVGAASAEASAVIPDTDPPTAPTALGGTLVGTSVSLSWTAATDDVGVARYSVHRGTTAGFTPTTGNRIGQPTGTSFTDSTAVPGTYYYVVTAQDAASNVGPKSNEITITIDPPPPPPPGLVGAYGFDEGAGTAVGDASGTGNAGTLSGPAWTAAGKYGGALSFDGVNDSVVVADAASLDLTTGMTLEAWVKPSALAIWRTVVFKEQTGNLVYGLYANRNTSVPNAQVHIGTAARNVNGTSGIPLDAWSHLATTYDGATLRLFVNGAQVGQLAFSGSISTSNGVLRIGGNSIWNEWFQGVIDEVRIYNRALSQAEIETDMTRSIGVPDTTVPTDPGSFAKTGATATSITTSWTPSADNVGIAGYDLYRNGSLVTSSTGTSYTFAALACNTSYDLGIQARDFAGNLSARVPLTTSTAACDNTAPSASVTSPATGATVSDTISVNGAASDNDSVVGVQFKLDGIALGAEDTTAPYSVTWNTRTAPNGNHNLTAEARDPSGNVGVSAAVPVTVSNVPIDPSGLVASYGFDAGTGTTAVDSSGQGNTGTISGAAWSAVGKFGHALSFDGVNDWVTVSSTGSIDLTAGMTLEAWVRPTALGTTYRTVVLKEQPSNLIYALYANRNTTVPSGQAWIAGKSRSVNGGAALPNNAWSHLAATYDGSNLKLFVNGTEVSSFAVAGSILSSNGALRIGGNAIWGEWFQGAIDEVRVYNRALTGTELQADMVRPVTQDTTAPTIAGRTPANGTVDVNVFDTVMATFNEAMDPASITTSTIQLTTAGGTAVPASVAYDGVTGTATLTPTTRLAYATTYVAKVKGGAAGAKDASGNAVAADNTWTFTTAGAPSPVLVLSSPSNPFSAYTSEIIRAEGFNLADAKDIATVNAAILGEYDVAVLGNISLTTAQVTMLTNWVNAGGNLIAFRPDKQLAGLLGLTDAASTLSNAYMKADTTRSPGHGVAGETMQFHGTADRYTLNGATALATLYSNASTPTGNPALTLRSVGAAGGQAAAFTYDLARSVVYTRQGNPAWIGQDRDGVVPIRPNDLFFGNSLGDPQPDWVDTAKMAIPQADEQQRLLANLILEVERDRKPLPRFWYFPRGGKAVVVMTGDDHAVGGTAGRWDQYKSMSPAGCSVVLWQCVRGTSYLYPGSPLTNAQAAQYESEGFEVGVHVNLSGGCANWTPTSLASRYTSVIGAWQADYPSVPAPTTHRLHCVAWSDWATQPKVELQNGMRLDTNYYHYPDFWIGANPGFMTGSGMPMRFADLDGSLIDVYQAHTFMPDESGETFPFFIDTLLDRALGPTGYYGWFMTNMHTDKVVSSGSEAIVSSAQIRNVPVISSRQMLQWTDGRDRSSFNSITWNAGTLSFKVRLDAGALGLQAMIPISSHAGNLTTLTSGGNPVSYTVETVKGVDYAVFNAADATYAAHYGP
jgi:fibronectin type 3 domain-containing protein